MEIGTEISKKIRGAIKSKLQELGAYIDEELPDYIMVMVANKKTSQQMTDDLSLFLGNNTVKFTLWLQGVLEKLRSVAGEPASINKHQLQFDSGTVPGKSRSSGGENSRSEESKVLIVSSSRSDRTETRVSSSAHESRKGSLEKSSSRLTSAVKPLMELLPSEAVIDIKPEMDDDLIAEEALEISNSQGRTHNATSRPSVEIYRPSQSRFASATSAEGPSHSRHQDSRNSRSFRNGSSKAAEEISRKRKAPVASSVVKVRRAADKDSDDEDDDDDYVEEDETSYGGRGLSSRVSLPSKPERRPTLPPAKQANRNLILKAISEAQDSITKTTAYPAIPQKQTVPVAPRTRMASSEEMSAAIQLVQQHLQSLAPRVQAFTATELPPTRAAASGRSLASRLQLERNNERELDGNSEEAAAPRANVKTFDTRSFIMSRPQVEEDSVRVHSLSAVPRTVQANKEKGESASPKFIVTLDGVPSPMENLEDCEMELDDVKPSAKLIEAAVLIRKKAKVSVLDRLQAEVTSSEDSMLVDETMEVEMEEESAVPLRKQKVVERCKFWPICKSGDECAFHHPTTQCKTFPNCKFGDKCLFVHPNCKYDARCTKPDCPFTHVSRRSMAAPPPRPAMKTSLTASVCRFFPECKNMDCPFYHPKPCRFATQCKRAGCTFYHPNTALPPRHALKWTKTQSS